MKADLLLAIDQGTTSTRAVAYDMGLRPVASSAVSLATVHPQPGWAEQDPEAILGSVVATVERVLAEVGGSARIAAVGLDNQGETVLAWHVEDGRALAPAVSWQCSRSQPIAARLRAAGLEAAVHARTGLPLDPYFSATKLTWLLESVPAVRAAAVQGCLRLGTVDAWLTARLDQGRSRTDVSTASRTQLLNLGSLDWDDELLGWFGVERGMLPRIVATAGQLGEIEHPSWGGALPLRAMVCDQQGALAGHAAFLPGAMKVTYGTGAFVLANAGRRRAPAIDLETSIAWQLPGGEVATVLQGGVFAAGTLVDWLRDGLGVIRDPAETEMLAASVPDTAGVQLLPALAGLGAPWSRPEARAVVAGLTGAAGRAQVVRAALDGIAQRVADVVEAMLAALTDERPAGIRVDGGLAANGYLMQRQADLLGMPVDVAAALESTALGVAGLAGRGADRIGIEAIAAANPVRQRFEPKIANAERAAERASWRRFVVQALAFRD